jgi:hypothetical protein
LDDEIESPNQLFASWPALSLSATFTAKLPPTEYVSSSMANITQPSETSEGSSFNNSLVDSHSLTDLEPSGVQSALYPEADKSSTFQRSKQICIERHIGAQLGDSSCLEDSCENPTDAEPMVTCAGPGCDLMVNTD